MKTRHASIAASALCAALTLFCIGGGVMSAQAVTAISASDGLAVGDLTAGVPTPAGALMLDTHDGFDASRVSDVSGFDVLDAWPGYVDETGTYWTPAKKGASLLVHHVGDWTDPAGASHAMDMRVTVTDWRGIVGLTAQYVPSQDRSEFGVVAGAWSQPSADRSWIELRLDLTAADGASLDGFAGVTGFADLDGGAAEYNEGWELISGFDTAYVPSDAHLTRYGENGWAGSLDENPQVGDEHGLKHYVGAVFTSPALTVRYGVAAGQSRGSTFMPLNTVSIWPLAYDLNGGAGTIPNEP